MPDHLHALLEAESEDSNFLKCVRMFKQRSAFSFRQRHGAFLWQEGFYDRTLRNEEQTLDVVAYILANPVRAGLCEDPLSYPLGGSGSYSMADLAAMIQSRP
jgi:REP element-mobilizing transposase RayT